MSGQGIHMAQKLEKKKARTELYVCCAKVQEEWREQN